MNKKLIANEIIKVANLLMSTEFHTEKALSDYLKKHPGADKSNHKVKKLTKRDQKKEDEAKKKRDKFDFDWDVIKTKSKNEKEKSDKSNKMQEILQRMKRRKEAPEPKPSSGGSSKGLGKMTYYQGYRGPSVRFSSLKSRRSK